ADWPISERDKPGPARAGASPARAVLHTPPTPTEGSTPPSPQRGRWPLGAHPADTQRVKESPGAAPGALGCDLVRNAPIVSQSVRRDIIRKHETRNQKD